jgi:hypothetical protein
MLPISGEKSIQGKKILRINFHPPNSMLGTKIGKAPRKSLVTAAARKYPPRTDGEGPIWQTYKRKQEAKDKRGELYLQIESLRAQAKTLRKGADCLDFAILHLVDEAKHKRDKSKEVSKEADEMQKRVQEMEDEAQNIY